jgi:hypothetical protein
MEQAHYGRHHAAKIVALDDCFVVRYDADAGGQRELAPHVDGGDISFMVALSRSSGYTGGGTEFRLEKCELCACCSPGGSDVKDVRAVVGAANPDDLDPDANGSEFADAKGSEFSDPCSATCDDADSAGALAVHLRLGECVSFDARITHRGLPITSGVRYLLVAFGHTEERREARVPGNLRWPSLTAITTEQVHPPVSLFNGFIRSEDAVSHHFHELTGQNRTAQFKLCRRTCDQAKRTSPNPTNTSGIWT